MTSLKQRAVTIAIAGALAIGTMSSSIAAPLMSSAAVIKAVPTQATEIAWRGGGRGGFARGGFARGGFARGGFRGGRGPAIAAGVAAGVIVGAAATNGYYGGPYYADPYYAGPDVAYDPGYAPDTGYGPPVAYVAPGSNSCWVWTDPDRGLGYRRC